GPDSPDRGVQDRRSAVRVDQRRPGHRHRIDDAACLPLLARAGPGHVCGGGVPAAGPGDVRVRLVCQPGGALRYGGGMKRFVRSQSVFAPSPARMLGSYVLLGLWAFVVLFPIYWLVVTSFKLPIQVTSGPVYLPWVDFEPSLHAWRYIFVEQGS